MGLAMKKLLLLLCLLASGPAWGQGSGVIPIYNIPMSRGPGYTGWYAIAPGANGNCISSSSGIWVASPCAGGGGGFTTPCLLGQLVIGAGVGLIPGCATLSPADTVPIFTGDVTSPGASLVLTVANNVITNAKLAPMAARTVKANITGGSANPTDVDIATDAHFLAGTTDKFVQSGTLWQAETTTTYGTTTTFDFSLFKNTKVTLTGNITTMTLSNVTVGKAGSITFIQDGTGSRTSVWSSTFKFAGGTAPVLTTTAGAVDILSYSCRTATFCQAALMSDVK